jgi:hypothetical protein
MEKQMNPIEAMIRQKYLSDVKPIVDPSLPQLTPVDACLPSKPAARSKPIPTEIAKVEDATIGSELSPRQLAAARMIARGRTPADVAQELGMTRQGLWKWRRMPHFAREVRRLHERISAGMQ